MHGTAPPSPGRQDLGLPRRRWHAVRVPVARSAGNNLALLALVLIHLFFLDQNRRDSRHGCGHRAMRSRK